MRAIAILSGCPGTGKTTLAVRLAEASERGVHLDTDRFYDFVLQPVSPILPESRAQNETVLAAAARAAAAFAENANLPFEVNDVRMDIGATGTRLSGVVKNLKLTQGDPVRLRITLIALTGAATASSDVEVSAPPINQGSTFAVSLKAAPGESDVAGWRYEVLNSPPVKPR